MISEALLAMESALPFKIAYKRAMHIRQGHPSEHAVRIDKLVSINHPETNKYAAYTVNVVKCEDCGLIYLDAGMEFR